MKKENLALWGLGVEKPALERLRVAGIYVQTAVRRVHQDLARRYMVRGEESGGATAEFGRYVTFADVNGAPLAHVQLVESLGGNGRHAIIVAPALLRIELFRTGKTCQMAITKHELIQSGTEKRPALHSTVIIPRLDGALEVELWRKGRKSPTPVLPVFFSRSGERREIPVMLQAAVAAATLGACCIRCCHNHYSLDALSIPTQVPRPLAPSEEGGHSEDLAIESPQLVS